MRVSQLVMLALLSTACSGAESSVAPSANGGSPRNGAAGGAPAAGLGGDAAMLGGAAFGGVTSAVGAGGSTHAVASSAGGGSFVGTAPAAAGATGVSGGAVGIGGPQLPNCVPIGKVSYTLVTVPAPLPIEEVAFRFIASAMDVAVAFYNCNTRIEQPITVYYDPTFEVVGGGDSIIRFGSLDAMNPVTAMHEIARVVGVGSPAFEALVKDGVFTGENATRELRSITGDQTASLRATSRSFSPYGLNYLAEVTSTEDLIRHCRMVSAILQDLGR